MAKAISCHFRQLKNSLGIQEKSDNETDTTTMTLSGLALNGTILLPLAFSEEEQKRRFSPLLVLPLNPADLCRYLYK